MILNLIIIIIVLLLSYLFLSNKKETFEAFRLPKDFYELHSFEDKLFIKINEKLQEYPNNVSEVLNQVKNKKIVETYIGSGKQQTDIRNFYNIRTKLIKPKSIDGVRINSSIKILAPKAFNLEDKLKVYNKLSKNDILNVSWSIGGDYKSVNVEVANAPTIEVAELSSRERTKLVIQDTDFTKSESNKLKVDNIYQEITIELNDDKLPNIPYSYNLDFIITKIKCNFDDNTLNRDRPKTKLEALKMCAGDGKVKYTNQACTYNYCNLFIDRSNYQYPNEPESDKICNFNPKNTGRLGLDTDEDYTGLNNSSEKKLKCIQKCSENGNDFCTFKKCKSLCNECTNLEQCPWKMNELKICEFRPKGLRILDCVRECQKSKNCDFDKCESLCRMCKNPEICKWYRPPTCDFEPEGTMLSDCIDKCIDYGEKNTIEGEPNPCSYKNCKSSCESCQNPMKCSWIVPKVVEQKCQFMPWGPNKQACIDRCVSNDKFKWGGEACTLSACTQSCDSCSNDEQCHWLKEPDIDPNIGLDNKDRPPVQRIRVLAGNNRIFIQWKQRINTQHPTIGYILQYFKTYRPIEGVVTRDMDISSTDILKKKNLEFELTGLPRDEYSVAIIPVNENGPGRSSNLESVKVPGTEDGASVSGNKLKKIFK